MQEGVRAFQVNEPSLVERRCMLNNAEYGRR